MQSQPRSNGSTKETISWFLKNSLQGEGPGLTRELVDSSVGQGKDKDLACFLVPKSKEMLRQFGGYIAKGHRSYLEEVPNG